MPPPLFKKFETMSQIIKPNGKRKWVWKYGMTEIPKLIKMYAKLNPVRDLAKWPKAYRKSLSNDSRSWKEMIYSLITPDEEKNIKTINFATEIFKSLSSVPVGSHDLWVLLCENISEIIKDELQYQDILKLILLTALHEKDHIHDRIADMSSILSTNPWFIMCNNIIALIEDENLKCHIILLFLALSGQQNVYLLNYLTGNKEEMPEVNSIENVFSLLFMTQERWVNLIEVIELLKSKRELLRMLSMEANHSCKQETEKSTEDFKPVVYENKSKEQDTINFATSTSEHTNIKWELNEDNETASNEPENHELGQEICAGACAPFHEENRRMEEDKIDTAGNIAEQAVKQRLGSDLKSEVKVTQEDDTDTAEAMAFVTMEPVNIKQEPCFGMISKEIENIRVKEVGNSDKTAGAMASMEPVNIKQEMCSEMLSEEIGNIRVKEVGNLDKTAGAMAPMEPVNIKQELCSEMLSEEIGNIRVKEVGNLDKTAGAMASMEPVNIKQELCSEMLSEEIGNIRAEGEGNSDKQNLTTLPQLNYIKTEQFCENTLPPSSEINDNVAENITVKNEDDIEKQKDQHATTSPQDGATLLPVSEIKGEEAIEYISETEKDNFNKQEDFNSTMTSQVNKIKTEGFCANNLHVNDDVKVKKQEKRLRSLDNLIFVYSFQQIDNENPTVVIKEECIDIIDDEDDRANNKKNESLTLEKLILDYSIQQINKNSSSVIINEDCIYISEDDDNEACVIQEDSKLEVAQLLNMYHEIVLDKPTKMLINPLAGPKKPAEVQDSIPNVATLQNSCGNFLRNPSTSSTRSKSSGKMNVTMSSQKLQNKIKRKRSKTNNSVRKLFCKLKAEQSKSQQSIAPSNNTVIVLDETLTPKKRKCSPKKGEKEISKKGRYFGKIVPEVATMVIPIGGQEVSSETPKKPSTISCSTPINKNISNPDFIPIKCKRSQTNMNNNYTAKTAENRNEQVTDLTRDLNLDSYLTIDLTDESLSSTVNETQKTVIDLEKLDNTVDSPDCSVISIGSNINLSLGGESDVTVLNMPQAKKERQMRRFAKGISKLDAVEKGRLLELITQNIFSGCNVVDKKSGLSVDNRETATRATETAEDTYIKDVILGQAVSRNSIGSNIYNPEKDARNKIGLRMIVIDGSNVAMEHGRGKFFSVKGLKICIDYFLKRGHVVKAFVPRFRCKCGKSSDPRLLDELERRGLVVYTPSREIQGRMVTSYDDRYIVQCAAEFDGIIVSGDNYRDLLRENPRWRCVIETKVLPFTWVEDMIMFPRDPLGRNGPPLEFFLRHPEPQRPVFIR